MAERQIELLIEELKVLKLREAEIISRIEDANKTRLQNKPDSEGGTRRAYNESVETSVNGISQGDRVRIKNRVRKPATWTSQVEWTEAKERRATVTRVTPEQIHVITDNGVRTWRAPNNVQKLP